MYVCVLCVCLRLPNPNRWPLQKYFWSFARSYIEHCYLPLFSLPLGIISIHLPFVSRWYFIRNCFPRKIFVYRVWVCYNWHLWAKLFNSFFPMLATMHEQHDLLVDAGNKKSFKFVCKKRATAEFQVQFLCPFG